MIVFGLHYGQRECVCDLTNIHEYLVVRIIKMGRTLLQDGELLEFSLRFARPTFEASSPNWFSSRPVTVVMAASCDTHREANLVSRHEEVATGVTTTLFSEHRDRNELTASPQCRKVLAGMRHCGQETSN